MLPAALLLAAITAAGGHAEEKLAAAKAAKAKAEFAQALSLAREALRQGDAGPAEVAAAWALAGEMAAVTGDAEAARDAFSKALELDGDWELPAGASPRVGAPYRAAKQALSGKRLQAIPHSTQLPDRTVKMTVSVEGDGNALVRGGAVRAKRAVGFTREPLVLTDQLRTQWTCEAEPCAHYIELTDAAGNVLLRVGSEAAPLFPSEVLAPPPLAPPPILRVEAPPPPPPPQKSWYQRPGPWLAVATVGGAVVTSVYGYRFYDENSRLVQANANRPTNYLSDAQALDAARRSDQKGLFIAGGVSAALLVGTVVFW